MADMDRGKRMRRTEAERRRRIRNSLMVSMWPDLSLRKTLNKTHKSGFYIPKTPYRTQP